MQSPTLSSGASTAKSTADLSDLGAEGAYGIKILYEGGENPTTDIVAVHGLKSHPFETWTYREAPRVMWLRDLLPNDLPNARIMTYGYNSSLMEDASMGRIRDFAKGLLIAVDDCRPEMETVRPLIFVCHSLGGLVVKQALVLAHQDKRFNLLSSATSGIIFLGTPHQGSSIADIGGTILSIIKIVYPAVRTEIVKSLQRNSIVLQDLTDDFRHRLSRLNIVSGYELQKTRVCGTKTWIVDRTSAVLNIEGEMQMPMEADHHRICRFFGPDDPSYVMVCMRLRELAEAANKVKTRPAMTGSMIRRIFDVPGLLSPCYVGRDSDLNRLRDILATATSASHDSVSFKTAAIYGMPGAGKTQLALKYATQYRDHYSAVFFVSAARISTLNEGYERIVSLLDLDVPERSRNEQWAKIAVARAWFEDNRSNDGRGWLLIVDNVNPEIVDKDDEKANEKDATVADLIHNFLPREGTKPQGSIILTTRKPRAAALVVGDANRSIELGKMDEKDAVELLYRASGRSNDDNSVAHSIAKELGYLPLIINQAGIMMKVAENIDFQQFLEIIHIEKDELFEFVDGGNPQQSSSIHKIYQMAFNGLQEKDPRSADIFRLFSFLDPERIPLSLLADGASGLPENMALYKVFKAPMKLSLALSDMRSGSLALQLENGKEKVLWVHDLVQYLFRQWHRQQNPVEYRKWAERAIGLVNAAYPGTLDTLESWQRAQKYLKHGQACAEHGADLQIQTLSLCDLMIRMSWFLRQTGHLAEAVQLGVRALDCAKTLGEGQQQHMNAASNLGLMYYTDSRLQEAKEQWTLALKLAKELLGSPGYIDTGIGNNLALLYYQEGRFVEAERLHREIYLRKKDVLGENHPETLGAMGSLANSYHFQGRLQEAIDLKRRILEGRRKHMSEAHPETLGAQGSLATTYSDQGHLAEAELLQKEVMVKREEQWGQQNPESLAAKGALSYTFYLQGRFDEAEEYQRQVLKEREMLWGKEHVETLGAMRHLAKTYQLQGRLQEAADLQQEVVFGMEKLLGKDHPEYLSAQEEISSTYRAQGLLKGPGGAEELEKQVKKERERLWGMEYTEKLRSMDAMARKHQGFAH